MPDSLPLNRHSVEQAHNAIQQYIHRTPVLTSDTLSALACAHAADRPPPAAGGPPAGPALRLFFKCENFQKVGAFKARGAFHALSRRSDDELRAGVITHSSGNHAQALALAARTREVKAYVVMPAIATPSKIAATRGYGAEVVFSGPTAAEREAVTAALARQTGALFIPPYDDADIILGQGTLALELEQQVGRLDAVVAPCGGAGLLAGIACALRGRGVRVFGAEPSFQGADDARRGLAAGRRIEAVRSLTIADGVRTPVGAIPWTVISDPANVAAVYSVSEADIRAALRLAVERLKLFLEPSAVLGLAVVLFNEDFRARVRREAGPAGWNVAVVLTGGNTTIETLAHIFATGDD